MKKTKQGNNNKSQETKRGEENENYTSLNDYT